MPSAVKVSPDLDDEQALEERKHALCCFGGGLRAMAGAAAIVSAGMVTSSITADEEGDGKEERSKGSAYSPTDLGQLMKRFSVISSNSGGGWFCFPLCLSAAFSEVLAQMADQFAQALSVSSRGSQDSSALFPTASPFYTSFLAKSRAYMEDFNKNFEADLRKVQLEKNIAEEIAVRSLNAGGERRSGPLVALTEAMADMRSYMQDAVEEVAEGAKDLIVDKFITSVGGDMKIVREYAFWRSGGETQMDEWEAIVRGFLQPLYP